jgi:hypothetical protein
MNKHIELVKNGNNTPVDYIKVNMSLRARITELEALCRECADYLDTNKHTNIGSGSKLHRDLRKQAGDL